MTLPTEFPTADPTPIYRYTTVQPATVRLALADLAPLLPEGAWIGATADRHREITLPAAEVLQTNCPRVRFSTLRDLLPDCLQALPGAPEWIALPAGQMALAYRPEIRRELQSAPATPPSEAPETSPQSRPAPPVPGWKRLPKPTLAPAPAPVTGKTQPGNSGTPATPDNEAKSLADLRIEVASQSPLRKIFTTGKTLAVQQLIDLAGKLPGVAACVLSRFDREVRSEHASPELDASAFSEGATGLVRKAGTASNLRLKPAVTLYTEGSPISFLYRGTTSLLVIHSEPGLLPRTIEKLEIVLEAIEGAANEYDTARLPRSGP